MFCGIFLCSVFKSSSHESFALNKRKWAEYQENTRKPFDFKITIEIFDQAETKSANSKVKHRLQFDLVNSKMV